MTDIFKQITQFVAPRTSADHTFQASVAQNLMERAGQKAGRNPLEAAELRDAARAFLSVVR